MINRRKFSTWVGVSALATALPLGQSAEARRECDLVVTDLRWSDDRGNTWHDEPVPEDASVLFQATIKNTGVTRSPSTQQVRIWFGIREGSGSPYETVAFATHTGGLAAGAAATLQADEGGEFGDGSWSPSAPGEKTLAATVDVSDVAPESDEGNNTLKATIEVQASSSTPVAVANDSYAETPVNTPIIIDVLANDVAPAGYALVVAAVQSPTDRGGTAAITADRKFVKYTPPSGYSGDDSFSYETGTVQP